MAHQEIQRLLRLLPEKAATIPGQSKRSPQIVMNSGLRSSHAQKGQILPQYEEIILKISSPAICFIIGLLFASYWHIRITFL
jgi:hypothetical protein